MADTTKDAVERLCQIEESGGGCADLQFTEYAPTLRALSAQLEAANLHAAALEAALDSIETSNGLTANGNVWRFWAKQANEIALKLKAANAQLEAANQRADAALEAVAQAEDYRDTLSSLASYLGAGMGDEKTTAEQFNDKIRWGIDFIANAQIQRCADLVERLSKKPETTWGAVKTAILALRAPSCDTKPAENVTQAGLCDSDADKPVTVTLGDLRPIWKEHGGGWHGPRVEHWSIPEANMTAFFNAALRTIAGGRDE